MNINLKHYDLLKALSWYTIGNIAIKLINFISLPLFTALLNTNDYGIYGLFQSYLGIFEIILLFGGVHTIKMLKYDTSINYNQYISSLIFIPVILTVWLIFLIHVYFISYCELGGLSKSIWICIFITAGITSVSICIYSKLSMNAIKNAGGIASCPADAVEEVKSVCSYISKKNAGAGAVRDIIDWLIY